MKMVSVVIPLFNKELYIARALKSVTAQTYQSFEVLVVDDGSTDAGAYIAECFPDPRIRVIRQSRKGVSAARNTGIAEARYRLIAFLDADDEWMPDFLDTVVTLSRYWPKAGMYATAYIIERDGRLRRPALRGVPEGRGVLRNYFRSVLGDIPVISSAVMVRKETFEQAGYFVDGSQLGEDQDMWCRIAMRFPVAYDIRPGAIYHQGTQNSICYDTSVIQKYPVMQTVEDAIINQQTKNTFMEKYLCKIRMDYGVRLIRARRLSEAAEEIRRAGWNLPGVHIRALYYLLAVWLKRIIKNQVNTNSLTKKR